MKTDPPAPPSVTPFPDATPSGHAGIRAAGTRLGPLRTVPGKLAGGAGVLLTILSLIFLIWPDARPSSTPPAPTPEPTALSVYGATFGTPSLELGVTLGSVYEARGLTPPASYSPADLAINGLLVSFDVVLTGFYGQSCTVTWTVLDAETDSRLDYPQWSDQPGWPDGRFAPAGQTDQANGQVWIPFPPESGKYLIRLVLFDPNGVRLTSVDSAPFAVP